VGAICALAAVEGGWLNVMINLGGLKDKEASEKIKKEANDILQLARSQKESIFQYVIEKIS
jgi:formiminotetrahydrofolate cyclodeaminase